MGKTLVLGGTKFLGVHLVEDLLRAGHKVTLFNRSKTNPETFTHVPTLVGDRNDDVALLAGTTWDTVYDLSGYEPAHVERIAQQINGDARYIFVSTVSVYEDISTGPLTEDSATYTTPLAEVDPGAPSSYGELKTLAERSVRDAFSNHVIVRPTVIAGALDPSGRITYWVKRWAQSGAHVVQEPQEAPVQFIDVRDLADWLAALHSNALIGTFNAGASPLPFSDFLDAILTRTGAVVDQVSINESTMAEYQIDLQDLPMQLPPSDPSVQAFFDVDTTKARKAGLRIRPVTETVAGILEWCADKSDAQVHISGLSSRREKEIVSRLRG